MPHKCSECGKSVQLKQHLNSHLREFIYNLKGFFNSIKFITAGGDPRKKPPPGTGRFECDICGNVYTLKGAMEVHRRCHAGKQNIAFSTVMRMK